MGMGRGADMVFLFLERVRNTDPNREVPARRAEAAAPGPPNRPSAVTSRLIASTTTAELLPCTWCWSLCWTNSKQVETRISAVIMMIKALMRISEESDLGPSLRKHDAEQRRPM